MNGKHKLINMKNILIILLVSIFNRTYAQNNISVHYFESFETDLPTRREAILQTQKDKSIYIRKLTSSNHYVSDEEAIKNSPFKQNNPDEVSKHYIIRPEVKNDDYYFNDTKNKRFTYTETLGGNMFLVVDDLKIKWEISKETKTIASYKTYKAITKFRGRTWEAWFAPKLAYPYGPWKLHGLPGLILEAYDESRKYTYTATQIYDNENNLSIDLKKIPEITLRKYTEMYKEYYDNIFSKNPDPRYKKTTFRSTTKGQEFDFEWETETK